MSDKWISVKERLPDSSALVTICLCGVTVTFGHYNHGKKVWRQGMHLSHRYNLADGMVTHWMPLPDPPKEQS